MPAERWGWRSLICHVAYAAAYRTCRCDGSLRGEADKRQVVCPKTSVACCFLRRFGTGDWGVPVCVCLVMRAWLGAGSEGGVLFGRADLRMWPHTLEAANWSVAQNNAARHRRFVTLPPRTKSQDNITGVIAQHCRSQRRCQQHRRPEQRRTTRRLIVRHR